jgi:hypothetical protein
LPQKAINALYDAGFSVEQVALVTKGTGASDQIPSEAEAMQATRGAEKGMAIGRIAGGLLGIRGLAIPRIGEVIAADWLASLLGGAASGAAFGGWIGPMAKLKMPEDIAHQYAKQLSEGCCLAMVLAEHGNREDVAEHVLAYAGAAHVQSYPYEVRLDNSPVPSECLRPRLRRRKRYARSTTSCEPAWISSARMGSGLGRSRRSTTPISWSTVI